MAILGPTAQSCGRAPRVNLKALPIAIALALSQLSQGPAKADAALLPFIATTTTIPSNKDLNPYGVAFVPSTFSGGGTVRPGDILVSNFNASSNLQGTGTTIIRYRPSDAVAGPEAAEVVFQEPKGQPPGLTLALGVLQRGAIVVGAVSTTDGTSNTIKGGPLFVVNPAGKLIQTIQPDTSTKINGPWGLAIADHFSTASLFVSNVLDGTVTRLDVSVSASGTLTVNKAVTIASGYGFQFNSAALVIGPAGLAYEGATDTLYVAAEVDNAIFKVTNASTRPPSTGKGSVFFSGSPLRGPVGLTLAPNGHVIASNSDAVNGDPTHPSEIVEFTHDGNFLREYDVNESQGAAFGVAFGAPGSSGTVNFVPFVAVNDASNDMSVQMLPIQ